MKQHKQLAPEPVPPISHVVFDATSADRDDYAVVSVVEAKIALRLEDECNALRATVSELREIVTGLVSVQDAVTQGQERERLNYWLPKARGAIK